MTTKPNRDALLVRAASIRAQIVAFMNKSNDFVLFGDIEKGLKEFLDKEGVKPDNLRNQLILLTDNGVLDRKRDKGRMYAYRLAEKQESKPVRVDVKMRSLKPDVIPSYKIDVVKGQKRVRITLDNVMFDIGLVEQ